MGVTSLSLLVVRRLLSEDVVVRSAPPARSEEVPRYLHTTPEASGGGGEN